MAAEDLKGNSFLYILEGTSQKVELELLGSRHSPRGADPMYKSQEPSKMF